jgi:hypothetical protein
MGWKLDLRPVSHWHITCHCNRHISGLLGRMGGVSGSNQYWGQGMKKRSVVRVIELMCGVAASLFIAGIVVPTLLQSRLSAGHTGFAGSLHMMKMAGMTFTFTIQNLIFAALGAGFGAAVALVVTSPGLRKSFSWMDDRLALYWR